MSKDSVNTVREAVAIQILGDLDKTLERAEAVKESIYETLDVFNDLQHNLSEIPEKVASGIEAKIDGLAKAEHQTIISSLSALLNETRSLCKTVYSLNTSLSSLNGKLDSNRFHILTGIMSGFVGSIVGACAILLIK